MITSEESSVFQYKTYRSVVLHTHTHTYTHTHKKELGRTFILMMSLYTCIYVALFISKGTSIAQKKMQSLRMKAKPSSTLHPQNQDEESDPRER